MTIVPPTAVYKALISIAFEHMQLELRLTQYSFCKPSRYTGEYDQLGDGYHHAEHEGQRTPQDRG